LSDIETIFSANCAASGKVTVTVDPLTFAEPFAQVCPP